MTSIRRPLQSWLWSCSTTHKAYRFFGSHRLRFEHCELMRCTIPSHHISAHTRRRKNKGITYSVLRAVHRTLRQSTGWQRQRQTLGAGQSAASAEPAQPLHSQALHTQHTAHITQHVSAESSFPQQRQGRAAAAHALIRLVPAIATLLFVCKYNMQCRVRYHITCTLYVCDDVM